MRHQVSCSLNSFHICLVVNTMSQCSEGQFQIFQQISAILLFNILAYWIHIGHSGHGGHWYILEGVYGGHGGWMLWTWGTWWNWWTWTWLHNCCYFHIHNNIFMIMMRITWRPSQRWLTGRWKTKLPPGWLETPPPLLAHMYYNHTHRQTHVL